MAWTNNNSSSSAGGGGALKYSQGALLTPSASTITPTDPLHHVAAGTISTIATTNIDTSVPNELVLIADGSVVIQPGGNISGPSSAIATNGVIKYVLDGTTWREQGVSALSLNVSTFGAVGDGKVVYDVATTAGFAIITSAAGRFLATDVGKTIRIENAGNAGGTLALSTTILSYQSATQVTLATNALATYTGRRTAWGTDDTVAIQAAVSAVRFTNAAANGGAVLTFGDGRGTNKTYCVTDTIDFGTEMQYLTVQGLGLPNVSGDLTNGTNLSYHGTEIRWLGADLTGKPIFWFKGGAYGNVVQRLGFHGGDEAIRIRRDVSGSAGGSLARNRIFECQFDNQEVSSIQWGFPTSDTNTNTDDADGTEIRRNFFYRTNAGGLNTVGEGIVMNEYPENGYLVIIDQNYFLMPATVRQIRMRGFYNTTITRNAFHYNAASLTDGTYVVDLSSLMGGWLDFSGNHLEVAYGLNASTWNSGPDMSRVLYLRNNTFNYDVTDAFGNVAIDVSGAYAIVEGTRVSNASQQRSIKFGSSGGTINNPSGAGAPLDVITTASGAPVTRLGPGPSRWVSVAYAAGNFSSDSGTWTLPLGATNQTVFKYTRIGGILHVNFQIDGSTITGTPGWLILTLPAGVSTNDYYSEMNVNISNNGAAFAVGEAFAPSGSTTISLYRAGRVAYAAGAANNSIYGKLSVPIS